MCLFTRSKITDVKQDITKRYNREAITMGMFVDFGLSPCNKFHVLCISRAIISNIHVHIPGRKKFNSM